MRIVDYKDRLWEFCFIEFLSLLTQRWYRLVCFGGLCQMLFFCTFGSWFFAIGWLIHSAQYCIHTSPTTFWLRPTENQLVFWNLPGEYERGTAFRDSWHVFRSLHSLSFATVSNSQLLGQFCVDSIETKGIPVFIIRCMFARRIYQCESSLYFAAWLPHFLIVL